jgi:tRNA (guanine-N7-)-methyltransferase
MRLRNIPGAEEAILKSKYAIKDPETKKGKWSEVFKNGNPIYIEVGMGKGRFIIDNAKAYPDRNFIGIEMYSSVLLRAIQKMDKMEEEEKVPENLYFICMDAKDIENVFGEKEIAGIYLNFSDPWPKDRHAKRRLTSRQFLIRFEKVLNDDGKIEFKTDNHDLFMFSLDEIEFSPFMLKEKTFDLHKDSEMVKGNIMTEYEEKFSSKGNPIYKYILSKKHE